MKYYVPIILVAIALSISSCVQKRDPHDTRPAVFVSIVPQKYFVDKISGGLVDCFVMVPPGTNAHSYEPRPAQMVQLSTAKAYFAIGLEFEGPWLPKFASLSKAMKIVHTDSLVSKIAMEQNCEHDTGNTGGGAGIHHHEGLDPHIWLSPSLVKIQAAAIEQALEEIDTAHAADFRRNAASFYKEIDSVDRQIRTILPCDTAHTRRAFLVFHPTWGYFAHDFCLKQVSIEVDGKEPSPRTMKSILDTAMVYGIHTVFAQPEYSRKNAEVIARELGANVQTADALAYNWPDNLIAIAKGIAAK